VVVFTAGKRRDRWGGNSTLGGIMGGAADFKVGYKTGLASGAREKKLYPHFSKCGDTSKQISVGAY